MTGRTPGQGLAPRPGRAYANLYEGMQGKVSDRTANADDPGQADAISSWYASLTLPAITFRTSAMHWPSVSPWQRIGTVRTMAFDPSRLSRRIAAGISSSDATMPSLHGPAARLAPLATMPWRRRHRPRRASA